MATVFETTEPDLIHETIGQQYTSMTMRFRGSRPLLRVSSTQIGRARVDRSDFGIEITGDGEPLSDNVIIIGIHAGAVGYRVGDDDTTYGPGETCSPLPPGPTWSTWLEHLTCDALLVDTGLLGEVAGADLDAERPVRLLSRRPHSPGAAARMWATSSAVALHVSETGAAAPLVVDAASRLLAASVLETFPNDVVVEPTIEDRRDSHVATLRRAVAFIESHPDQPLTLADVARAAYVSTRAVQLAFRTHLDTTPMAYLRRVRLDRAHRDLVHADPAGTTVAAVAATWGFANLGRFASSYRATFAELPSETLRR